MSPQQPVAPLLRRSSAPCSTRRPRPATPATPNPLPTTLPPPLLQGYRYAMPHSILMMHHPSGAARGQASDMHIEARELVRMRDYLSLLISDHTGQPYDRVRGRGSR